MLEVSNVRIYDLEESIIASGYAMKTTPYSESTFKEACNIESEDFKKGLKRTNKLVQASKNTDVHCHDNFLTGIRVSFDVKYPQYWSMEAQRYHFFDIVTSASKMHRLLKMNIEEACNKYVTQETKDNLKKYIEEYNILANKMDVQQTQLYPAWMKVISNCPLGLELFMRVSTNYKQLQTIYFQRRHHRLVEDWQDGFCKDFIEKLPYFKEFILGENNN